jgi:hypothetical protein
MSKLFFIAFISCMAISLTSCYYDNEEYLYGNSGCDTSLTKGPTFTQTESIIQSNCGGGGCHLSGGRAGGYNFDNPCSIVSGWSRIQAECVNSNRMPPGAPLSSTEKSAISDWIAAGHKYDN